MARPLKRNHDNLLHRGAGDHLLALVTDLFLKIRELVHRRDDEEGQGVVEYALILVLIAVVVIVVLTLLGNQVRNVFRNISGGLGA
jgi:pilus assembly protein Flp/PilA